MTQHRRNSLPGGAGSGTNDAKTRTSIACDRCAKAKIRCDGMSPCGRCKTRNLSCTLQRPHSVLKRRLPTIDSSRVKTPPERYNVESSRAAYNAPQQDLVSTVI